MWQERELKARGRWGTADFVDFTAESLDKLDQYAFYRDNMDVPVQMDAQEKMSLKNGQELHYVRAPQSGIYEVENTILNHRGSKGCACVVFHDGKAKWTVKLSGFVNDMSLVPVTEALNAAESDAKRAAGVTDEALLRAGWGGGGTIIGAPRYHNGAGPFLSRETILDIVTKALDLQITA